MGRMPAVRGGSVFRVAVLALLWGSGFLWTKLALRGFTPEQVVLGRLALGRWSCWRYCAWSSSGCLRGG